MADTKLTALTELTAFSGDEQVYVVDDDDGTPASRRMTVENLAAGLAARAELTGAFVSGVARELFVDAGTGSDSNDGLTPDSAFLTISAAVLACGTTGGTIRLRGSTSFAPVLIDGTSTQVQGIRIVGQGPRYTLIDSTGSGVAGVRIRSGGGASTTTRDIMLEGLAITGTGGHGVDIGDGVWAQTGHIRLKDVRIFSCTGDGIRIYNTNNSIFDNVDLRSNTLYGVRVTGRSTDGTGGVTQGNTNIFLNCSPASNVGGGWLFDQCGNSWSIIGGETSGTGAYGVTVVPGVSVRGITFVGHHFENNVYGAFLGDLNATGLTVNTTFTGCHFTNQTGSYDVALNGAHGVLFDNCHFGATAGIKDLGTFAGQTVARFEMRSCTKSGTNIFEDAAGTVYTTVKHLSQSGRRRLFNSHSVHADTIPALDYIKDSASSTRPHRSMANATAACEDWMGAGSPEGVITAPIGSIYRNTTGGAGATIWIKESGAGNTGWIAK